MQADVIIAVLKRWIEVLAKLVLAWREQRRSQRTLMINEENGALLVHPSGEDGRKSEPKPKILSPATAKRIARSARGRFLILALSADKVVTRHLNVPAQAREFLAGIVRNQIERLSPWPVGEVMYGFHANAEDGGSLDIEVLMTSRTAIDGERARLAAAGLEVDRIVARRPNTDATTSETVTLWARITDAPQEDLATATRLIGVGIAASVAWAVILSIFTLTMASSIRHEDEDLAARAKTLQRQLQAGRTPASMASLPAPQRAWLSKETSASSVIVLEALSRALPDSAHLAEIRFDGTTLRIIGNADDAPVLLAPLEQTGHLSNVHFFAPTTRGPDGRQFRFHIEARVEPHIKIADEAAP